MKTLIIMSILLCQSPAYADFGEHQRYYYIREGYAAALGTGAGLVIGLDAPHSSKWTMTNTVMESIFVGATVVDMLQTLTFRAEGRLESNPLLGKYPSNAQVISGIAGAIVFHAIVARLLPHPWREMWQGAAITVEVSTICHNSFIGGIDINIPL